jgi:DNA-binding response OmpR family regulator
MFSTKRRLLLVDDEQDITSILCSVLQESGFEVVSFNDPLLALQHFRPRYYNLVILDIIMPDMNGFELYRQIRSKDKRVKVCFLTAVGELEEYEQYKKEAYPKMGERYFIAKPVSNDELIRRVNEILK